MAFHPQAFVKLRPYAYHLTAGCNLDSIRKVRVLRSAAELLSAAGETEWLARRRREKRNLAFEQVRIEIRDQFPLHRGNLILEAGFSFEEFVQYLNSHIFFWPGTLDSPSDYGRRHFARYSGESPAVVRVSTADLLRANPNSVPKFSRYNSGSPRWVNGSASPRSRSTFSEAQDFEGTASQVVELAFSSAVTLPVSSEVSGCDCGSFGTLWQDVRKDIFSQPSDDSFE